jgi:hypothetical protein
LPSIFFCTPFFFSFYDGRREDSEADENSKSSDDGIDWDTVDKYAALSIYSDSSSMEEEDILADDLVNWTNQFQVNHNALDALLKILKKHGHSSLPSTDTELATMMYYYF